MPEIVKIVLIWVGISFVTGVIFIGGLAWFNRKNKGSKYNDNQI